MTRGRRAALVAGGVAAAFVAVAMASCSPTATNNPLRSFQNAQKVDVVCMQVGGPDAAAPIEALAAIPVPQELCSPVPPNVIPSGLSYHLFALVTQVARGEVAVVDVTAGEVVDVDRSTPGLNFLTVGALPTDIAAAPDGRITFVASAAVNMPAIYALPSNRILGDSQVSTGLPADAAPPVPNLTTWPACALPQAPGPIAVIPTSFGLPVAPSPDAGDAGPSGGGLGYVLAVVLPGDGQTTTAKVVTIDPAPLLRGAGLDAGPGDTAVAPGSLEPCPIIGRPIELAPSYPAAQPGSGPAWDNGVPYVDAASVSPPLPEAGTSCVSVEAGVTANGGSLLPAPLAHATAAVHDGQTLFVADDGIPVIHVIDFSNPEAPVERAPLVATSASNPSRQVSVGQLAVSPPTREYKRFLYAVDTRDNPASLMVFDVTDLSTSPHVPLTRPYPALNPLQPRDRIIFGSPVATVAFVQHDFPLTQNPATSVNVGAAAAGLLCNPNPNAGVGPTGPFKDQGADYRANATNQPEWSNTSIADWPSRLRGVFAFATLSNGTIAVIDVDDWDSPCRRPDPESAMMTIDGGGVPSDIAPVEPSASSSSDLDPYHAPNANPPPTVNADPTSQEAFFPVSAPHRARSVFLLRDDPTTGIHIPFLSTSPELGTLQGGTLTAGGPNPILLATASNLADPYAATIGASFATAPNVRFAWEDPTVHVNQTWTVTYEGQLPAYQGLNFLISTPDKFQTLTFSAPAGTLCSTGVEDFDQGTLRANAALDAIGNLTPPPENLTSRTSDYVQITTDLTQPADPYWSTDNSVGAVPAESCWDGIDQPGASQATLAAARYNACLSYFQPYANQEPTRDFPILQAYDDHFVVGIFDPKSQPRTLSPYPKQEVSVDNAPLLKLVKCCFQNRATVNVRTAGEWVAVGTSSQLFHHVIQNPADQRCVQSCDPTLALLNARSIGVLPASGNANPFDRNSPAAMRNPMFSYVTFNGMAGGVEQVPARDDVWTFTTNGAFTPLSVNIAASNTSVSPQSMLFIPSIAQLAVVDGSSQGLILIDLNLIAESHAPYF